MPKHSNRITIASTQGNNRDHRLRVLLSTLYRHAQAGAGQRASERHNQAQSALNESCAQFVYAVVVYSRRAGRSASALSEIIVNYDANSADYRHNIDQNFDFPKRLISAGRERSIHINALLSVEHSVEALCLAHNIDRINEQIRQQHNVESLKLRLPDVGSCFEDVREY